MRKVFGIATLALGPALFATTGLRGRRLRGRRRVDVGRSGCPRRIGGRRRQEDRGRRRPALHDSRRRFRRRIGPAHRRFAPRRLLRHADLRGLAPRRLPARPQEEPGTLLGNEVKTGINDIPIMLGGRYFFMQPYSGVYGNLEIGMNMMVPTASVGSQSNTGDTQTRFGANIGGGYVISKELPINIGAQLAIMNLIGKNSGESTLIGINILAGYEARF